jgi:hypothetical protein
VQSMFPILRKNPLSREHLTTIPLDVQILFVSFPLSAGKAATAASFLFFSFLP